MSSVVSKYPCHFSDSRMPPATMMRSRLVFDDFMCTRNDGTVSDRAGEPASTTNF